MQHTENETLVTNEKVSKETLATLAEARFGDMVTGVIDVETGTIALGGEFYHDTPRTL